jgi:hypothetical protein
MSRKPIAKFRAITSLSAASAQISKESNVEMVDTCSYHVKFSAPASGDLVVEARNADTEAYDSTKWFEVNFGAPLTITAEIDVQILLNELPFKEIRLKWVPSSASGTFDAFLVMKAKGA